MTLLATLLATASLLLSFPPTVCADGYDATQRDCDGLCLTSFHCCSTKSGYDVGLSGCTYPEDAYPYFDRQGASSPAMLVLHKNYTVTWKNARPDIPVRIMWGFSVFETPRDDRSLVKDHWDTNTTKSSFVSNPLEILESFPTKLASNTSSDEARAGAVRDVMQTISISQPQAGIEDWGDVSQQFTVQPGMVTSFMEAAVGAALRDERRKWKLGVGIGVGVAVPIILGATTAGCFLKLKKAARENRDH